MNLLNETLSIAYGEDKAKEMIDTQKQDDLKQVVIDASHRYLTKEDK